MNRKNFYIQSMTSAAIAMTSVGVFAAGFQLNEYSTTGLGRAFSGEGAVADNAAVGSRNPAAMTLFDKPSVSVGITYIKPDVDIKGTSPVTGASTDASNIAPAEWVPNLHFIMPLNEHWALGTSITSNFGLSTKFNDDYPAGSIAGQTELKTGNLNLSAAYRLNPNISFGLGFDAVYAQAKIKRTGGEVLVLKGMPATTSVANLKGNKWGYGWNAGVLYEINDDNRYALTYRSKVDINFKGDYSNELPTAIGGTGGATIPGSLTLNLPEIWEISGYNKVASQWALHYGVAYTTWKRFKELKAVGNNDKVLFEKHEGFKNAYRVALGTTYYHDQSWTFRSGIAFDATPVPAEYRSISIPDQDRLWLSAGATFAFNEAASVDAGISFMHGKKTQIKEKLPATLPAPAYEFSAKGTAMLYAVNFNYSF
jgi:long-chain fatty acid transport protein